MGNVDELTREELKKIFGMYIYSEAKCQSGRYKGDVNYTHYWSEIRNITEDDFTLSGRSDWFRLVLKNLSDITDEDAIEVTKMNCKYLQKHYQERELEYKVTHRNTLSQIIGIEVTIFVNKLERLIVRIEKEGLFYKGHPDTIEGKNNQHFAARNVFQIFQYLISMIYANKNR